MNSSRQSKSPEKSIHNSKIEMLERSLHIERKKLVLYRHPIRVLTYFSIMLLRFLRISLSLLLKHGLFRYMCLPLFLLWAVASFITGEHHVYLETLNFSIEYGIWWIGLGILSSVGLGTGMHSGILFLFPHIFFVVQGVEECQNVQFDTFHHIWFTKFQADCIGAPNPEEVRFLSIFYKVMIPSMLWGMGTALGEIPPYAISRAAKLAGIRNEEFEEATEHSSSNNVFDWMKDWMIGFLQTHGFWGVLLMSAWPNMAFDLCGICCGHFMMPFWTFLGATVLGKAVIKSNLQAMFFITIFMDKHLKQIEYALERIFPESWKIDEMVTEFLVDCRHRFHAARDTAQLAQEKGDGESMIAQMGTMVMVAFMLFFASSCMNQFAQQYAAEEDAKKVQDMKKQE